MAEETKKIFHDSLQRCLYEDGFFKRFYVIFINSSDEVKEKFKDTDMEKQVKMLTNSFYTTKLAINDSAIIRENLKKLAHVHGKNGHDIRPELYDLWLRYLIQTVKEYDPQFDGEIAAAWKKMLEPGLDYMKNHYQDE